MTAADATSESAPCDEAQAVAAKPRRAKAPVLTPDELRKLACELAVASPAEHDQLTAVLTAAQLNQLNHSWALSARVAQWRPAGEWSRWLILAGRGFGKTRAGCGWLHDLAVEVPDARMALIGATLNDARSVMVEGESGLLATAPPGLRPRYEPSRRRLVWPGGAQAQLFSAEEPESLRGPQFHFAWGDEAARWPAAEALLANLQLGLRLGTRPRLLLTTTPRPHRWLKALVADPACVVVRGRTMDNETNLPAAFIAAVTRDYGGTRLGRQELDGEIIDDLAGALWTRAGLDGCRVLAPPLLGRIVVAVDPPAGSGAGADACGIIVAALGIDGKAYVLADRSVQGLAPDQWMRAVVTAAGDYDADRIIAEVNNGGAMIEQLLRHVDEHAPYKAVRAAHGKVTRAEPVAALYARGLVRHVGALRALEDELCGLIAGGTYHGPGRSPDRADACVWALTELMLGMRGTPGIRNL